MAEHWEKKRRWESGDKEEGGERGVMVERKKRRRKRERSERKRYIWCSIHRTGRIGWSLMEAHLTSIPVSTSMKVFRISCSFCSKITAQQL